MRLLMLFLICLSFTACVETAPKVEEDPKPDPKIENPDTTPETITVVGEWKHSAEEDTTTEKIYRVADYKFPPARAREGFVFNKDGSMVMKTISPNDTLNETKGTWEKGENNVVIELEDKTKISLLTNRFEEGVLVQSTAIRKDK